MPITKHYITIHEEADCNTVIVEHDSQDAAIAAAERQLEGNHSAMLYVARVELKLTTRRETVKERMAPVNGGHA